MQGGHMGSRVVASLLALSLGAGPMVIGVLIAAYSIFPLIFASLSGVSPTATVHAGPCWAAPLPLVAA